jgi:hypothetical protein
MVADEHAASGVLHAHFGGRRALVRWPVLARALRGVVAAAEDRHVAGASELPRGGQDDDRCARGPKEARPSHAPCMPRPARGRSIFVRDGRAAARSAFGGGAPSLVMLLSRSQGVERLPARDGSL